MDRASIVAKDKAHVWHPYTAMDDYVAHGDPIVVARGEGAWLVDLDGRRYLDGNASWWTSALGHAHPRLLRALTEQAGRLAHVALAGTTHEAVACLAEELCAVAPKGFAASGSPSPLDRVFFTDNGSTAVEVALKMALQRAQALGQTKKRRFLALDGAFHGETLGVTALGGVEVFRRPFAGVLLECVHAPPPRDDDPDPDGHRRAFQVLRELVTDHHETLAAVVVEPLVQGASGMRMYPPAYLKELAGLCQAHDVLLIADEVFSGYGRTGPMWACEAAGVVPDVLCVGKAFSSLLPMGATLVSDRVFSAFRGGRGQALLYGHTFCGNPLGAAVAREVLAVYRDEGVLGQVASKAPVMARAMEGLRDLPGVVRTRSLGMVGAADLRAPLEADSGYLSDLGWRVYDEAKARGAHVRPLGSTVYLCPPLVIPQEDLELLLRIFHESIAAALA